MAAPKIMELNSKMVVSLDVVVKEVDEQGRVVIPKEWRRRLLKDRRVIMKLGERSIEVLPANEFNLTNFFNSIEVDVESDLSDWHSLRRELRKGKG